MLLHLVTAKKKQKQTFKLINREAMINIKNK